MLLGEHGRVVDFLSDRLARLGVDDGLARVVVLRGPSGCGKSRVVRELYGRLVARQPVPGYWPMLVPRQATLALLMVAARLMTLRSRGSVAWLLRQMM